MHVRMANSDAELPKISAVLLELRTGFDPARLVAQIRQPMQAGYPLADVEADGEVLCVAGVQRNAAHRFYLREGFNIASHHFSVTELGGSVGA